MLKTLERLKKHHLGFIFPASFTKSLYSALPNLIPQNQFLRIDYSLPYKKKLHNKRTKT